MGKMKKLYMTEMDRLKYLEEQKAESIRERHNTYHDPYHLWDGDDNDNRGQEFFDSVMRELEM
jgi:hypothetical protein